MNRATGGREEQENICIDLQSETKEREGVNTYLFDFDGTLVDSMPNYVAMMLDILREHNVPHDEDIIRIITPLGFRGTAEYFRSLGMDVPLEELVSIMRERAVEAYTYRIPAKEHVLSTLRYLKARGDDLNVLTASPHETLDPCLKRLGVYDLFTNVWSCEDFGTTKADPAIYHMAAERIGRPVGEIWFLDDNLGADQTAKAAGMRVCGVYDDSSKEYTQAMIDSTDAYIRDFSEIGVLDTL